MNFFSKSEKIFPISNFCYNEFFLKTSLETLDNDINKIIYILKKFNITISKEKYIKKNVYFCLYENKNFLIFELVKNLNFYFIKIIKNTDKNDFFNQIFFELKKSI